MPNYVYRTCKNLTKIVGYLAIVLYTQVAQAQVPEERRVLALARIFVSEVGFNPDAKDLDNIGTVLKRRSNQNRITIGIMRAYSTKTFDKRRTDARRWIPWLTTAASRPRNWYTNASWQNHRSRWLMLLKIARRIIKNGPRHSCTQPPDHWGARGFRYRMRRREGWLPLQCGGTKNQFWAMRHRNGLK